jgi:hypothetical protein
MKLFFVAALGLFAVTNSLKIKTSQHKKTIHECFSDAFENFYTEGQIFSN